MEFFRLSQSSRFINKQNTQFGFGKCHYAAVKREIKTEDHYRYDLLIKTERNINETTVATVKQEIKTERRDVDEKDSKEWHYHQNHTKKTVPKGNQKEPKSNLLFKGKRTTGLSRKQNLSKAIRLHKILIGINPNSLNNKQLSTLTWAESVIVRSQLWKSKNSAFGSLGNHSAHNRAFISNEKTTDLTIDLPDLDIEWLPDTDIEMLSDPEPEVVILDSNQRVPNTFQLVVVDFGNPGGRYTQERAHLITKELGDAVIKFVLANPKATIQPKFGSPTFYDGVLVLDCKDQVSYDFAKLTLHGKSLWDGCNLTTLPPAENPFCSIGSLAIPPKLRINQKRVLDALQAQNKSVNMIKWKILNGTSFADGSKEYAIMLYNPPISFLKNKQFKLSFGAGEVILKQLGCKWLWNSLQEA